MRHRLLMASRGPLAIVIALTLGFGPTVTGALAAGPAGNVVIRGVVATADKGASISGARVYAVHLDTKEVFTSAPSAAKGEFQITGLPFGYYDVAVETPAGLYLANRVINAPSGEKIEISLLLGPPQPEDTEWWSAEPDRSIPGLDRVPDGVARIIEGKPTAAKIAAAGPRGDAPLMSPSPGRGRRADRAPRAPKVEIKSVPIPPLGAGTATRDLKYVRPSQASVTKVRRYPTLEAPPWVNAGRTFTVAVSLTLDRITPEARATQATMTPGGAMELTLPAARAWEIDVSISAPGFTVQGDGAPKRIHLPEHGDSTVAEFRLVCEEPSTARSERKIFATLWHEGRFLGRIIRAIVVTPELPGVTDSTMTMPATAARAVVNERVPEQATLEMSSDTGPDLTIQIDKDSRGVESIVLASRHWRGRVVRDRNPTFTVPDLRMYLSERYRELARLAPRSVEKSGAVSEREAGRKQRTLDTLRSIGRRLWSEAVPDSVRTEFWKVHDLIGSRAVMSIQVVTNDPDLPWELVIPSRTDHGKVEELGFLGIIANLARWPLDNERSFDPGPLQALRLSSTVAVVPLYPGTRTLPHVESEIASMQPLPGFRRVRGRIEDVRQLFRTLPEGIVHFAGHGTVHEAVAGGSGTMPEYSVELEDATLDLETWNGLREIGGEARPLFFFNACDLGQVDSAAGFVNGWGPDVLRSGATGYIGGLWPLGDAGAAEFARKFYARLATGLASGDRPLVTQALSEARKSVYKTGDPTFLAYVFYGDSLQRIAP